MADPVYAHDPDPCPPTRPYDSPRAVFTQADVVACQELATKIAGGVDA